MRPEEPYSPTSDRKLSLAEHPRSLRAICSLIESLSWRTDSLRSLFSVVAPPSKCSRKVLAGGFWGTLVSTSKDTSKYTYSCNQKTREHNYELKPKHVCMLIHSIHIHRYHTHTHAHLHTASTHRGQQTTSERVFAWVSFAVLLLRRLLPPARQPRALLLNIYSKEFKGDGHPSGFRF